MPLRRLVCSLAGIALPAALVLLTGCAKDVVRLDRNRPPQTFIVAAPLDSAGIHGDATKASYRVHLYWRGLDSDGYVVGFLWSFDDSNLTATHYTTKTDSVFELVVNDSTVFTGTQNPGTTKYHSFFIRAVDNLGKADPNLAVFNRRTFLASTLQPKVGYVGGLPTGRTIVKWVGPGPADSDTVPLPDTLADGKAFRVCWTGFDPDNPPTFGVPRYKFKIGNYESGLSSDTCAFFNDVTNPKSVGLASDLYTMTVFGYDVANAVGTAQFQLVVNYDPDTWLLPRGAPVGHYIQKFLGGSELDPPLEGTFAPGDTVPYRSTVWWDWESTDSTAGETNCIIGWSIFLAGSRNDSNPYTIGFRNILDPGPPPIRFKTNNPAVVGPLGFVDLILDSLDAVPGMHIFVRARDCSGRIEGTPASFGFSCDFPPTLISVASRDSVTALGEPAVWVEWDSQDYEDGRTKFARLRIDGSRNLDLENGEQGLLIPLSTFTGLLPGVCEGAVQVRVFDRAKLPQSNDPIEIRFPLPDPNCPP